MTNAGHTIAGFQSLERQMNALDYQSPEKRQGRMPLGWYAVTSCGPSALSCSSLIAPMHLLHAWGISDWQLAYFYSVFPAGILLLGVRTTFLLYLRSPRTSLAAKAAVAVAIILNLAPVVFFPSFMPG